MELDMSAVSAPPRKATPRKAATKSPVSRETSTPGVTMKTQERIDGLNGIGQIIQVGCIAMRQNADAAALGIHWPGIARETAILAERSDGVAKLVDTLSAAGPYTALIAVSIPLILQVMVNHKVLSETSMAAIPGMNVVPPSVLEKQTELHLKQIQAEALRQQREAEKDIRDLEELTRRMEMESERASV